MNIKNSILKKGVKDYTEYASAIQKLKEEKNAVILAHYYQEESIQEVANYLGDSLYLAQQASKINNDIIVLAGVHFMAETAKIINPLKKVLIPDLKAGCSLADSCPPKDFATFKAKYPRAIVISYINCSAEIKTLSDIVCTSSNAKKIVESIPRDKEIIFAPDKNLGAYLNKETNRNMILWDGSCVVHEAFSFEKIVSLIKVHPKAKFIAHPESESPVLDSAHYIGSTSALLNFVQKDKTKENVLSAIEFIENPIIKNLLMQQINVSDKKKKKLELTMKNLTDVIELNENMESNLEELFSEIDKIGISEFLSKWKKNN